MVSPHWTATEHLKLNDTHVFTKIYAAFKINPSIIAKQVRVNQKLLPMHSSQLPGGTKAGHNFPVRYRWMFEGVTHSLGKKDCIAHFLMSRQKKLE